MGKVRTAKEIDQDYINLCAQLGDAFHRIEEAEKFIKLKQQQIEKLSLQQFQLNAESDRLKQKQVTKEDNKAVEDVLLDQPGVVVEANV